MALTLASMPVLGALQGARKFDTSFDSNPIFIKLEAPSNPCYYFPIEEGSSSDEKTEVEEKKTEETSPKAEVEIKPDLTEEKAETKATVEPIRVEKSLKNSKNRI